MSGKALRGRTIAREAEVAEVAALVGDGPVRVVTLTGVGGVGKTTIADGVAEAVGPRLADGLWRVDLAVHAAGSVAHRLALVLGLPDQHRTPVEVLGDVLAPREALLVLDNCEHVVEEVADLLGALVARAPGLRVLATSRIPLRLGGERIYPVPPLGLPRSGAVSRADLEGVPSVELFVDRARASYTDFALTDANAAAVADICRRLEGIPLALEIAASGLVALSVESVRDRVAAGDGSPVALRGRPEHQRTVEATLDWSIGLLAPAERTLLPRLAVFTGGWALDAVGPACSLDGDLADPLGALVGLVEHSLVVRVGDGSATRYRLLEPVRQHVARLLEASGEQDAVRLAHARHFTAVATARESGSTFLVPADVARIRADEENCVAALRWAHASGTGTLERALVLGLSEYFRIRGQARVAVVHVEAALTTGGDDLVLALNARLALSNLALLLGDARRALAEAEAAHALATTVDDPRATWMALGMLGDALAEQDDLVGAREAYERARAIIPRTGASTALAFYHANTGGFALRDGNLTEAEEHFERARTHFEDGPDMWFSGRVLVQQGEVARRRGELARAEALVLEGLGRLLPYSAVVEAIPSLEELAKVESALGLPELATMLLGAASSLREETGLGAAPSERPGLEALVSRLQGRLGRPRFLEVWSIGRGTGLTDAVAAAAGRVVLPASRTPSGATLTPREQQVAELVSEGLTNRAIADRLGMAPGTARIHVERILAKLGLTSRVQVATWVVGTTRGEDG